MDVYAIIFTGLAFITLLFFFTKIVDLNTKDEKDDDRTSRELFYGTSDEEFRNIKSKNDGEIGEEVIYHYLLKIGILERQILRNVYLPTNDDETTEIDILVASRRGILVLECKNYSGHIYGQGYRRQWVQFLGKGEKYYLYSPIYQNRNHIRHVREFLGSGRTPIIPFTVVTPKGKWKVSDIQPNDHFIYYYDFKSEYEKLPPDVLSNEDIKSLIELFKPYSDVPSKISVTHINRVKQIQMNYKNKWRSNP